MNELLTLGVVGFFGNIVAVVIGAFLTAKYAKRAQEDAAAARLIAINAERMLATAQFDASESVARIARGISRVEEVAVETRKVAASTHTIVNSQRTLMLRALLVLATRISHENPDDIDAHLAMDKAASDLHDAEVIEQYLTDRKSEKGG